MEVSNASLYDGGTALAEAALMALRVTGRKKVVLDGGVNPAYRRIVRTYLSNLPVSVIEVSPRQGISHRPALVAALDDSTAAVIIQNPDFFGGVDDYGDLAEEAHSRGALLVASVYPISLGLLKAPGETGADIVVGDGQSLGNPLNFGGPSFGFITTHREYVRSLPGRLVGETIDKEGRRGFVLTLQTREQHIKRHRATSNICSNQSLCALRGLMFLCSLGREGLVELARLNYDKAEYAKALLGEIKGVSVLNAGATFNEFTLALPTGGAQIAEKLLAAGIAAGIPLGPYFADMEHCLVVTVTEKRTKKEIETFARRLEEALWS
jgi:glycine dehydrogenase subunit 1